MSSNVERRLKRFPAEFPRPDEAVTRRVLRRIRELPPRRRRAAGLRALALAAALAAGVGIGHWTTPASAIEAATFRNVDVTLICTVGGPAGFREVSIGASPKSHPSSTLKLPGILGVGMDGPTGDRTLAGVEARGASGRPLGSIYVHRMRCSATQARIPLTRAGLPGPPVTYGTGDECAVGRRVILRLRARLLTPGPWEVFGVKREFRGIRRNVASAAIAVRTWPGKKPLGFATLDSAQNTRLWTAYDCA